VIVAGYRRLDLASVAIGPGRHSGVNQPDRNDLSDKMFAMTTPEEIAAWIDKSALTELVATAASRDPAQNSPT
jgi:hypothetical protein